jgi:hypothetical protein
MWAALRKLRGMLEVDEVTRGRLTFSQILIMSESMPSTRSIPAIMSVGVSGWVSEDRFVSIYWLMVTTSPSMTRQAVGAVDFADIEPKQMSTGLPRKSALLSGKMTPLVEAIELHEEP